MLAELRYNARTQMTNEEEQAALYDQMAELYADPLGFVLLAWPWGVTGGPLENQTGPDENQRGFLEDLGRLVRARGFDGHTPVEPIRMCISSANGTGKSTMGGWITWWILSTRKESVGTVTAGTYQQLEERTWSDIMHWGRMCITAPWFDIQVSGIFYKDPKYAQKWKVTPKTARAENAQSFAGQHAATSTSWFLFDEASEVPDANFQTAYPCLTDGEPMMFAMGQMLRTSGEFYNIAFGEASSRWNTRIFDGRKSAFTSKELIAEWEKEYGEDSDYYRVHALGLPPRASSLQFIGQDLVDAARKRQHKPLDDEPLVVGYDAANGGLARHAIWFRRGLDGASIPPIFLPGDTHRDVVVAKLAEIMAAKGPNRVAALFGDQAFGSVIIERLRHLGFTNCFEVSFGSPSPDQHYGNQRAYMWAKMKEWLDLGAIPNDERLAQPFTGPGFHHRNGKLYLESKEDMAKRKVKSPDGPDALALTFARPVAVPALPKRREEREYVGRDDYSPYQ